MQRDIHFYMTLACAKLARYHHLVEVAWSNYMTDCCKGLGWHTQVSGVTWLWSKAGLYYHFLPTPGAKDKIVSENSELAQELIKQATNPFERGIALHAFQDTFSHQGFTGTNSKVNDCFTWDRPFYAILPNYGHTDMRKLPDMVDASWFDPRNGETVYTPVRAERCIKATLRSFPQGHTIDVAPLLEPLEEPYDKRKRLWAELAGFSDIRFSEIKDKFWKEYKKKFVKAAKRQRTIVKSHLKNI